MENGKGKVLQGLFQLNVFAAVGCRTLSLENVSSVLDALKVGTSHAIEMAAGHPGTAEAGAKVSEETAATESEAQSVHVPLFS